MNVFGMLARGGGLGRYAIEQIVRKLPARVTARGDPAIATRFARA